MSPTSLKRYKFSLTLTTLKLCHLRAVLVNQMFIKTYSLVKFYDNFKDFNLPPQGKAVKKLQKYE